MGSMLLLSVSVRFAGRSWSNLRAGLLARPKTFQGGDNMSYKSQHMYRKMPTGRFNASGTYTVSILRKLSWKELLAEDPNADGNTRFPGDKVVLAFLKCNLSIHKTGLLIGYRGDDKARAVSVTYRLKRSGVGRITCLLDLLVRAGKMPKKHTKLLHKRRRASMYAVRIAIDVIYDAFKRCGTLEAAIEDIGIDMETARYWIDRAKRI